MSLINTVKEIENLYFTKKMNLGGDDIEDEDIEEYKSIKGASEEEIKNFERDFNIVLPENFKELYRYKNGSGYIALLYPNIKKSDNYCLMTLEQMRETKTYFQNRDAKMSEFADVIEAKQIEKLDKHIEPYLFHTKRFPFADYCGLSLMLDYIPSQNGKEAQIISYIHDPDFVYYIAEDIETLLKTSLENIKTYFEEENNDE